jgi:hypothetical protein
MPDPIETLRKEWPVIKAAPWSLVAVVTIVGVLMWFFMGAVNQGTISAKDATIQTLTTQVASYKEKLNGATPDEAKSRIDALERKVEERFAKFEPRHVSKVQHELISKVILSMPQGSYSISIQSDMGCSDCKQYAADFLSIFPRPAWSVIMPSVMGPSASSPKGLAILTPDPANPLPEATALVSALNAANIPFDLKAGGDRIMDGRSPPGKQIPAILITPKSEF